MPSSYGGYNAIWPLLKPQASRQLLSAPTQMTNHSSCAARPASHFPWFPIAKPRSSAAMICWFLMEVRITATSQESLNSCLTPPARYDGGILERRKQNDLWTRRRSCSERDVGVGGLPNELLLTPEKLRTRGETGANHKRVPNTSMSV